MTTNAEMARIDGFHTIQPNPLYADRLAGFAKGDTTAMLGIPDYLNSPADVIRLLEKHWYWTSDNGALGKYKVRVGRIGHPEGVGEGLTFCAAACEALARANGGRR
jgi:hypothetical protein